MVINKQQPIQCSSTVCLKTQNNWYYSIQYIYYIVFTLLLFYSLFITVTCWTKSFCVVVFSTSGLYHGAELRVGS